MGLRSEVSGTSRRHSCWRRPGKRIGELMARGWSGGIARSAFPEFRDFLGFGPCQWQANSLDLLWPVHSIGEEMAQIPLEIPGAHGPGNSFWAGLRGYGGQEARHGAYVLCLKATGPICGHHVDNSTWMFQSCFLLHSFFGAEGCPNVGMGKHPYSNAGRL